MMSTFLSRRGLIPVLGLVVIAVIIGYLFVRPDSSAPDPAKIYKIGYQKNSLYRHVFIAEAKGLFEAEGLKVELVSFPSANQMMSALLAGQLSAAGLTNLEVALRVEAEDPDQIEFANFLVWTGQAFPDFILDCTSDRTIKSLTGLKGKTLGRHPGSAVDAFAKAVLKTKGVDPATVTILELQPNLMRDAANARRVDALYAMDPVATQLVQEGTCAVLLENPLGQIVSTPIPISGTALAGSVVRDEAAAAVAITRALDKAIDYTRRPGVEDEVAGIIAQYTSVEPELARALNPSVYWKSSEIEETGVQRVADRFYELGISETQTRIRTMIYRPQGSAASGQ